MLDIHNFVATKVSTIIFEVQFQKRHGANRLRHARYIELLIVKKKNRLVEYQNLLLSLCGNTNNSAALFTNNRTWINTNNATWINTDSAALEEASICRDITAFAKFIIGLSCSKRVLEI